MWRLEVWLWKMEVASDKLEVEKKPNKCWGDYSDSEAEVVEVTS